jgi:hypothetical protein
LFLLTIVVAATVVAATIVATCAAGKADEHSGCMM